MISKYTKNSKIHQALEALSMFPMDALELRRKIFFRESMQRFEHYIVTPITNDKLANLVDYKFVITDFGRQKLENLGTVKKQLPPVTRVNEYKAVNSYCGDELKPQQVRPEANIHFDLPSRSGNTLRYRDGRVTSI